MRGGERGDLVLPSLEMPEEPEKGGRSGGTILLMFFDWLLYYMCFYKRLVMCLSIPYASHERSNIIKYVIMQQLGILMT